MAYGELVVGSPVMSRATFLRGALAAGAAVSLGGVLASCSGDDDGDGGTAAGGLPVAPTGGAVGGPLAFFGWFGYDFTELLGDWQSANGVEMLPSFINSYQDISPKILAGEPFDVLNSDQGFNPIFEELGILTQIEDVESLVPNLAGIDPQYVDPFRRSDGSLTGVPFSWGTFGIVYNVDTVDNPPTKWADLLEPEFSGRVSMRDDPEVMVNVAAMAMGLESPGQGSLSASQLDEALEWLRPFKDQAPTLSPSIGDQITLFDNGEVDVCFAAWPALKFFVSEGTNLENVFPEDRSVSYISTYWVPTTAESPANAYAYMNHIISEEFQPQVPGWAGDAMVRVDLADQLDASVADLYPYQDATDHLQKNPMFELPSLETEREGITTFTDWRAAWDDFKA